jgi:hypothetical protein
MVFIIQLRYFMPGGQAGSLFVSAWVCVRTCVRYTQRSTALSGSSSTERAHQHELLGRPADSPTLPAYLIVGIVRDIIHGALWQFMPRQITFVLVVCFPKKTMESQHPQDSLSGRVSTDSLFSVWIQGCTRTSRIL